MRGTSARPQQGNGCVAFFLLLNCCPLPYATAVTHGAGCSSALGRADCRRVPEASRVAPVSTMTRLIAAVLPAIRPVLPAIRRTWRALLTPLAEPIPCPPWLNVCAHPPKS